MTKAAMSDVSLGFMRGEPPRRRFFWATYEVEGKEDEIALNKELDSLFIKIGYFCAGTIFVSFLFLILAFVLWEPGLLLVTIIGFGGTGVAISVGETTQKQHKAQLTSDEWKTRASS